MVKVVQGLSEPPAPPVMAQLIVVPITKFKFASVTVATRGFVKVVPPLPLCPFPDVAVIKAAVPELIERFAAQIVLAPLVASTD